MGRIPSLKRIVIEEFPAEHRKWLVNLIDPINDFLTAVYQNFNKGITFDANIQSITKDITFTKTALYPAKASPLQFKNPLPVKLVGLWILNIQENISDPGVLSDAITLDWTEEQNVVKIRNITGLTNGTSYKLKVLGIGG